MADHFENDLLKLSPDVVSKILMSLGDSADLIRASSVKKSWRDFLIKNGLCKQLCLRIFPQLAKVASISELDVSSNSMQLEAQEHRVYASLFKALTAIKEIKIWALKKSGFSTDNYPEESIGNTEVPETLIYELRADFFVITEINIPFPALKSVRFRMRYKNLADEFIWTSQDFPMSQENHLHNFKLSEPVLCIGGVLEIELLVGVQTQASVSRVEVLGRSLTPAFRVGNLEKRSGEFSLKYSPQALLRTLQNPPSVASPLEHGERRMRGLMQFSMQRNEQGGELFGWEDDFYESEDDF